MIPMSHLSFVQCEQIKFRPCKDEGIPKCCGRRDSGGGRGGCGTGGGGIHVMSHMT